MMNNIAILHTLLNNSNEEVMIDARDLYNRLEITKNFEEWFLWHIDELGLLKDTDYIERADTTGYILTSDVAKLIALSTDGITGRAIRQYFIDMEKLHRGSHNMSRLEEAKLQLEILKAEEFNVMVEHDCLLGSKLRISKDYAIRFFGYYEDDFLV
jgi:phage anti-repressor protein